MRKQVLALLANQAMSPTEKYNEAFALYRNSEGKDPAKVFAYNRGFSQSDLKFLLYDLQHLYKITDLEIELYTPEAVEEEVLVEDTTNQTTGAVQTDDKQTKSTTEEAEAEKQSLREAFPFLGEDDCPDVLKILVNDKITLWHKLKETRDILDKIEAGEKIENADTYPALAVELFEQEQAINEELVYYGEHKKLLGKHSTLKEYAIQEEIEALSAGDLTKLLSNSKSNLSKYNKKLKEGNLSEDKVAELNDKIATTILKMNLAKKKLGINE